MKTTNNMKTINKVNKDYIGYSFWKTLRGNGTITTNAGLMKIEFYDNDAPNTVKNFCDLANKGFYEGLTFHRVIPS